MGANGGAFGLFLCAAALSFRPRLSWLMGVLISVQFVYMMLAVQVCGGGTAGAGGGEAQTGIGYRRLSAHVQELRQYTVVCASTVVYM